LGKFKGILGPIGSEPPELRRAKRRSKKTWIKLSCATVAPQSPFVGSKRNRYGTQIGTGFLATAPLSEMQILMVGLPVSFAARDSGG
jgi:hypothetical protein